MRVSVTTLEQFRRVVATDFGDEQELIDQIKGKFTPSWQMQAGSAWDALLSSEAPTVVRYDKQIDVPTEYKFDPDSVLYARKFIGPGLCQVKGTRVFDVNGCGVNVVAQADHVRGLVIQENKAKFSTPSAGDYETSLQWRFYLMVHGAACVQYNLWHFHEEKGVWFLSDLCSFRFWTYPALEMDCQHWLPKFLDWARWRKLTDYLEREGTGIAIEEAA